MKPAARERSVLYDVSAPRRAANVTVNVTVNVDLLRRARELDVDLSQTREAARVIEVADRARQRWLAENLRAIDACKPRAWSLRSQPPATTPRRSRG